MRFSVATLVLMAVLFLAAGKLDWWEGWAYVIQAFIVLIFSRTILIRKNPDLAQERAAAGKKENVRRLTSPSAMDSRPSWGKISMGSWQKSSMS